MPAAAERRNSAIFRIVSGRMRSPARVPALWIRLAAAGALASAGQAAAQTPVPDSFFEGRPAFSRAEETGKPASCEDIAAQLPESVPRDTRVDMAIAGPVTLLQTDGTVWYVAVCPDPGVRVLCVTYSAKDLKLGDHVVLRGGYNRQNARHVMLDPCLTAPE
jgi:hypothetical protein